MLNIDNDGQQIQCIESDGRRLWRCSCEDFHHRAIEHGEGFCSHSARAIMQAILAGQIRRWS